MKVCLLAFCAAVCAAGVAVAGEGAAAGTANASAMTRVDGDVSAIAKIKSEVSEAFAAGDFKKLEQLRALYRANAEATPSGYPNSYIFYINGIGEPFEDVAVGDKDTWSNAFRQADRWMHAYPRSATAILVKSQLLRTYAWDARGDGYADSVSEERNRIFEESLQSAFALLKSTKQISSQDPNWYAQMLDVSNGLAVDNNEFASVVDEALKRFPDFYPAFTAGLRHMLPKWGGSDEAVKEYALHVVQAVPASEADVLYARIYASLGCCDYTGTDIFRNAGADWPRLRSGLEMIRKQYPDPQNVDREAELACRAGDLKTMRLLMPMIGDQPILRRWHRSQANFENCKRQISLFPPNVDSVMVQDAPQ